MCPMFYSSCSLQVHVVLPQTHGISEQSFTCYFKNPWSRNVTDVRLWFLPETHPAMKSEFTHLWLSCYFTFSWHFSLFVQLVLHRKGDFPSKSHPDTPNTPQGKQTEPSQHLNPQNLLVRNRICCKLPRSKSHCRKCCSLYCGRSAEELKPANKSKPLPEAPSAVF